MDCKRPDKHYTVNPLKLQTVKNRVKLWLVSMLCVMPLVSCTWVKDDTDDCPYGFWLKLHYTYNILDVEAAPEYVTDAHVYVYDANGNYVKRINATWNDLKANDYRIRVEDLAEGDYQFVVWSGMGNSQYSVAGDTQAKDEYRLSLVEEGGTSAQELPSLFYGSLPTVHYDKSYAVHHIDMMKDTNQLVLLAVPVAEDTEVSVNDFSMKVVTANGIMDARNQIATEAATTYLPFAQEDVTFDDPDYGELHGAKFGISTLRLMENSDCRIILEKSSTGETVFNISLPEYIGMIGSLYTNLGRQLSVQEYLDRQDFYTIVFYLSGDLDQLIQLRVNSWRVRAYNHLKL